LPTKYVVKREAWITQTIFTDYFRAQCVRCRP
jgi:hypothetical protein